MKQKIINKNKHDSGKLKIEKIEREKTFIYLIVILLKIILMFVKIYLYTLCI